MLVWLSSCWALQWFSPLLNRPSSLLCYCFCSLNKMCGLPYIFLMEFSVLLLCWGNIFVVNPLGLFWGFMLWVAFFFFFFLLYQSSLSDRQCYCKMCEIWWVELSWLYFRRCGTGPLNMAEVRSLDLSYFT